MKSLAIAVLLFILAAVALDQYYGFTVAVGSVAIVHSSDGKSRQNGPGRHYYNPLSEKVEVFDVSSLQETRRRAPIAILGRGFTVKEYSVLWRICDPLRLPRIYWGVKLERVESGLVDVAIRESVQLVPVGDQKELPDQAFRVAPDSEFALYERLKRSGVCAIGLLVEGEKGM